MASKPPSPSVAERATALVAQRQALLEPIDLFVRDEVEIFGGAFVTVTFRSNKEQRLIDSFVFFCDGQTRFFRSPAEFATYFDTKSKEMPGNLKILTRILESEKTAELLGLIITATICYLAINKAEVPKLLEHALTTILGFYFGTKVNPRRNVT